VLPLYWNLSLVINLYLLYSLRLLASFHEMQDHLEGKGATPASKELHERSDKLSENHQGMNIHFIIFQLVV